MSKRRRRLDRVGVLLLGLLLGFGVSALIVFWYVDRSRTRVVEERVQVALGLPEEAFELEEVEEDGSLRILLRQVVLLDKAGDTIVSAPTARGRLDAGTLSGKTGPIVMDQVVVERPYLRLLQRADGEWNYVDIFKAEAGGAPLELAGEDGEVKRPIAIRGMRIVDGRARIATPYTAPANPNPRFASLKQPERVRTAGGVYTIRWLNDVQAMLPLVRVGGAGGWRVEVGSLTANVRNPDTRIQRFAGWFEQDLDQTLRFDIAEFRTPRSEFDGEGRVRFADAGPVFDLNLRAHPLSFADLGGMGLPIPATGTASFALNARSQAGGRTLWRVTDARVAILDSRASGRVTVLTGPGMEPSFSDTRLSLDPLRLADLETLGYIDRLPLLGTVTGEIASLDVLNAGDGGPLRIDLSAALTPRDAPGATPSVLAAAGLVRWAPGEDPLRFQSLRVEAKPLRLEHLAGFLEQPNPLLRGVLTGTATVSGSAADVRILDGDLAYAVGNAPETVLRGLAGRFQNGETPRWEFSARAQPLALATLTELFPALPFRTATLAGPISASGVGDDVRFDVDLTGASGGIEARGSLVLGDPLRFDVSGRLDAFRASGVLAGDVPLDGPLSGTFSARGAANDFRFAVDMTQGQGSFNLAGDVRRQGTDPYQFDVAGRVDNFRIGALIGKPGLLPGPVSGPIAVSGGGRQPYRFDVALTGPQGLVDVRGTFLPGTVPSYTVAGRVQNLDLSALPGMTNMPATRLSGTIDVEGRGTTPETFAGRVAFDAAPGSTVGGVAIETGTVRLTAADGILNIQRLLLAVRGARLEASGTLGLAAGSPDNLLRFEIDAPNLGVLAALIPPPGAFEPEIAGSLQASGWVAGTLRYPEVAFNARGSGLRWQTYQANQLAAEGRLARGATVWTGNVRVNGEGLALGNQTIRSVALEANLAPEAASFGIDLRKDENTDLRASGILELQGLAVSGVLLRDMDLRLRDTHWTLGVPQARLARTDAGIVIDNLRVQRTGTASTGFIEANGVLPTSGSANLVVNMGGIEMAELRQLVPTMPDVSGTLALNASITGPIESPSLVLDATVDRLAYGGLTTDRLAVQGRYDAGTMQLTADVLMAGRPVLDADAAIPMDLTLGGLVPGFTLRRGDPLSATLRADSLPLQLITAAVPTMLENGVGAAVAQVAISGTLDNPRVAGTAGIAGALTVVPLGVRWEAIDAALRLEGQTIQVERATARTGTNGVATITGRVVLDQLDAPDLQLALVTTDFLAIDREDVATLQADANLTITGRFPGAEIGGRVQLEDGTIHIPELGEQAEADIVDVDVGALGADTVSAGVVKAAGLAGLIPRDLVVAIGESVWLESADSRIQIAGELTVYEAAGALRVYGDLETVRGTYTLRVGPVEREFEVVRGTVQFSGTPELNPRLDIVARHEVRTREPGTPDIGVLVNLGGTMQAPTLTLSSETRPPLPESELLTLLLFGRRSAELANLPAEFTQGIILEQLLGGVLTNELEQICAGLAIFDYCRLRARPTGSGFGGIPQFGTDIFAYASLEAGKEVFEDAFAVLEIVDLLTNPKVGVSGEWQATRSWTFRGAWEPVRRDPLLLNLDRRGRQMLLEGRRRWEYGRPPEQPDPLEADLPTTTDEPKPGELSTPTGQPPPPPPDDSP
ncbi:translocation/assembly module TamB domain-containing protein [Longimicrobium sp.]|uniref:translocation/assembly module TamB domain-containing protein n=1 Tax=Longimicrobium sp. TaxID=2029185 RepID=UPI003B3BB5BF